MARSYARIKSTVWVDEDWRNLPLQIQWAYMLLLSQPQINNCGVLPYVPTRWARLASGLTADQLHDLMGGLDSREYVVVDEDTAEILVRTFIKHDEIERQPKLVISAKKQFQEIQSARIRAILAREYPQLFAEGVSIPLSPNGEARKQAETEPLPEPLSEGVSKGVSIGRAREGQVLDLSPGPLTGNQQPQPTAAAALDRLRTAGWTHAQLEAADLQRAIAWLDHAEADPTCRAPGALAWTQHQAGGWPPPTRFLTAEERVYADPTKTCPGCGETLGDGHLETCPRLAVAAAGSPPTKETPERADPPAALAALLGRARTHPDPDSEEPPL